jgi:hypothetical protein
MSRIFFVSIEHPVVKNSSQTNVIMVTRIPELLDNEDNPCDIVLQCILVLRLSFHLSLFFEYTKMTIPEDDSCCCEDFCSELLTNFVMELDKEEKTAKQKRFALYKIAANFLRFKSRTPLPGCIVKKIKEAWPEENNIYTGYKESNSK